MCPQLPFTAAKRPVLPVGIWGLPEGAAGGMPCWSGAAPPPRAVSPLGPPRPNTPPKGRCLCGGPARGGGAAERILLRPGERGSERSGPGRRPAAGTGAVAGDAERAAVRAGRTPARDVAADALGGPRSCNSPPWANSKPQRGMDAEPPCLEERHVAKGTPGRNSLSSSRPAGRLHFTPYDMRGRLHPRCASVHREPYKISDSAVIGRAAVASLPRGLDPFPRWIS